MSRTNNLIGMIMSGSLTEGLIMRVDAHVPLEQIKTGKFVCVQGKSYQFFSLITDLTLETTNPDIALYPPGPHETLLQEIVAQRDIYAIAKLKPMLMVASDHKPVPVKTIPAHFAPVFEARAQDVARIFGDEQEKPQRYFRVGCPLDMKAPVCLDLDRLTERSNGIFGKTGTGKTFITRLLLAGLIKHEKAVNLVFDMHSEYGLQARQEGQNVRFVKGLKTLFPDKVALCSLDPASTRRRGGNPDIEITLTHQAVHVDDILSLQDELNLHATAVEAAYLIYARYKHDWLSVLLAHGEDIKEFAQAIGAHPESVAALYRKLKRVERLSFFVSAIPGQASSRSIIDELVEYLDRGVSVIIEFGNHSSNFVYLLIANMITRRIHQYYIAKTERFLGAPQQEAEPKKLLITIEEAHKFLNTQAARQTIFGTIAREMRKYYVSLLVVDQRPSGIDQEVLSQIGTKLVAQLNDERDIQAVLTGNHNATSLRTVLASLDSKKQVLLLGHAVAMPVVIETREYDEIFYRDMAPQVTAQQIDTFIAELF